MKECVITKINVCPFDEISGKKCSDCKIIDPVERKFELHWKDGKTEIVKGYNIGHAFSRSGYGNGALAALDYYQPLD